MTARTCPGEHKHAASTTCYQRHGCRCTLCIAQAAADRAVIRKAKAYGRYEAPRIDAARMHAHLDELLAAGFTIQGISRASGVHPERLRPGAGRRYCTRAIEAKVLAVTVDRLLATDSIMLSSRGARRRLEALQAIGWSMPRLHVEMQVPQSSLCNVLLRNEMVRSDVHRAIATGYERLWHRTPPIRNHHESGGYTNARRVARAKGYLPPMAWDDIDTDEHAPAAQLAPADLFDEVVVDQVLAGHDVAMTVDERLEVIRRMAAHRHTDAEIAARVRITDRQVLRIRIAAGIPSLIGPDRMRVAS